MSKCVKFLCFLLALYQQSVGTQWFHTDKKCDYIFIYDFNKRKLQLNLALLDKVSFPER